MARIRTGELKHKEAMEAVRRFDERVRTELPVYNALDQLPPDVKEGSVAFWWRKVINCFGGESLPEAEFAVPAIGGPVENYQGTLHVLPKSGRERGGAKNWRSLLS